MASPSSVLSFEACVLCRHSCFLVASAFEVPGGVSVLGLGFKGLGASSFKRFLQLSMTFRGVPISCPRSGQT